MRPNAGDSIPPDVPAISLAGLSKSYGSLVAVRDLSLEVVQNEIFGFLGLNGAGKTTTIRILLDLIRPTRGSARLFGRDCQTDTLMTRRLAGYLPGELGLYPDMTGLELLDLMADLSGVEADIGYRLQLLQRLDFGEHDLRRQLREYSTGMKRKLGLVQALQADPPLVILDEPTEGLDPLVQRSLHEILFDLRRRGRTVFMSSHVLSEVERLCDRIAVIRAGELVLVSTVAEAKRRTGRTVRVKFSRPVATVALPQGVTVVEQSAMEWTLCAQGEIGTLLPLISSLPVSDLETIEPALEDVLTSFYREAAR